LFSAKQAIEMSFSDRHLGLSDVCIPPDWDGAKVFTTGDRMVSKYAAWCLYKGHLMLAIQ
jgi:hypothetical protein